MISANVRRLGTELNDGTLALAALAILLVAAVLWSANNANVERTDFALTYVGAHMVHSGMGRQLYDVERQIQLRDSLFQQASPLYFEHPPFEAVMLAPLASLPYRAAYLIWGLFNVAVLLGIIVWLRPYFAWPREDVPYVFLWLLFAPLGVAIYQGQSSIVLLAAYAAAFVELKHSRPFIAGAVFALALVKFQFAIPMALIFLFRKQGRFLGGFVASAMVLAGVSLAGVGWGGIRDYLQLLSKIGANPQNVSYGSAVDMPTIHGLIYALGGRHLGTVALSGLVIVVSLALLAWVARRWQTSNTSFELMFAGAIAASLLSGPHMFTQDFSPLIISMFLAASYRHVFPSRVRACIVVLLALFWAFPLYFLFVKWHCLYLMAVVMLGFTWLCVQAAIPRQRQPGAVTEAVAAG